MKNPFTALFRARDKPRDSVSAAPVFYFGTSGSGKSVTAQTAIQLSTVYACVRVVSETVASLPLGVYEATDDGNLKAGDHPLYHLLHDEPNAEMTSFVFREVMLAHLLLYGNSYSQKIASPSRVFRDEIGSMTMKGFGEGVLQESRVQARTIRNAARFLTGEAKEGAIAFGNNDNRKTYNQTSSVNLSGNNFYVRDEQDIRSLAIEIATLTKRQQRGRGLRMA